MAFFVFRIWKIKRTKFLLEKINDCKQQIIKIGIGKVIVKISTQQGVLDDPRFVIEFGEICHTIIGIFYASISVRIRKWNDGLNSLQFEFSTRIIHTDIWAICRDGNRNAYGYYLPNIVIFYRLVATAGAGVPALSNQWQKMRQAYCVYLWCFHQYTRPNFGLFEQEDVQTGIAGCAKLSVAGSYIEAKRLEFVLGQKLHDNGQFF